MLFTIAGHDKPGHLALRQATRPQHIAYAAQFAASMIIAGPLLDEAGDPCGSHFVMEFPNRAAAEAFAADDPYAKAGLFAFTNIFGHRAVFRDGAAV